MNPFHPKNGGAAFPVPIQKIAHDTSPQDFVIHECGGMSLRDYFAAMALQSIINNVGVQLIVGQNPQAGLISNKTAAAEFATGAYFVADAMLIEREKS